MPRDANMCDAPGSPRAEECPSRLNGGDQPQSDRERFAEHLALFIAFQFGYFFHHAPPVRGDLQRTQHVKDALGVFVARVESTLAATAREVGDAERPGEPFAVVAGLEGEDGL